MLAATSAPAAQRPTPRPSCVPKAAGWPTRTARPPRPPLALSSHLVVGAQCEGVRARRAAVGQPSAPRCAVRASRATRLPPARPPACLLPRARRKPQPPRAPLSARRGCERANVRTCMTSSSVCRGTSALSAPSSIPSARARTHTHPPAGTPPLSVHSPPPARPPRVGDSSRGDERSWRCVGPFGVRRGARWQWHRAGGGSSS